MEEREKKEVSKKDRGREKEKKGGTDSEGGREKERDKINNMHLSKITSFSIPGFRKSLCKRAWESCCEKTGSEREREKQEENNGRQKEYLPSDTQSKPNKTQTW